MTNKITLKAQDGSTIEFYDEIKAQGGVKDVYFSTDKTYVVAFYRKPINANDKARINDIVNVHRNRIFTNDAVGHYWSAFFAWPTKIVEWKGLTGIVIPFYDKKFFFSGITDSGAFIKNGQEKNGKWFSSAKLINLFVPTDQKELFGQIAHVSESGTCHTAASCSRTRPLRPIIQQCAGRPIERHSLYHRLRQPCCASQVST